MQDKLRKAQTDLRNSTMDLYKMIRAALVIHVSAAIQSWHTLHGPHLESHYVVLDMHMATHAQNVELCKQICTGGTAKGEPQGAITPHNHCTTWGFSYVHNSDGTGQCRFPMPPWKTVDGIGCATNQDTTKRVTRTKSSCQIACDMQTSSLCSEYSIQRVTHKITPGHNLSSTRDALHYHCILNIQRKGVTKCTLPVPASTLYFIPDGWLKHAIATHHITKGEHYIPSTETGTHTVSAFMDIMHTEKYEETKLMTTAASLLDDTRIGIFGIFLFVCSTFACVWLLWTTQAKCYRIADRFSYNASYLRDILQPKSTFSTRGIGPINTSRVVI